MSSITEIFITGATGYIGGSIVDRLLVHPKAISFKITALVRSHEKASKLNTVGIKTHVGSNSDVELLTELASKSDVVFAVSNCDDLSAAKAILSGLQKRHEATGKPPILIHTSGTGITYDGALGNSSETIYNDLDVGPIHALPETNPHRNVDVAIIGAAKQGYVKSHLVIPPIVFGLSSGRLVDLGVQNRHSVAIPWILKGAVAEGKVRVVGEGKNIWGNVHVDELADLYIVLFDSILENPDTAHGINGIYFAENDQFAWGDLHRAAGAALFESGKIASPDPIPYTSEEIKAAPMLAFSGTNSRCIGDRSRTLGWNPVKKNKDMFESIKAEVDILVTS